MKTLKLTAVISGIVLSMGMVQSAMAGTGSASANITSSNITISEDHPMSFGLIIPASGAITDTITLGTDGSAIAAGTAIVASDLSRSAAEFTVTSDNNQGFVIVITDDSSQGGSGATLIDNSTGPKGADMTLDNFTIAIAPGSGCSGTDAGDGSASVSPTNNDGDCIVNVGGDLSIAGSDTQSDGLYSGTYTINVTYD